MKDDIYELILLIMRVDYTLLYIVCMAIVPKKRNLDRYLKNIKYDNTMLNKGTNVFMK